MKKFRIKLTKGQKKQIKKILDGAVKEAAEPESECTIKKMILGDEPVEYFIIAEILVVEEVIQGAILLDPWKAEIIQDAIADVSF